MASTLITTNADALSRAADAILARGEKPSKNAILNALAAAISGPGHDWAFIKNAPNQTITQPGLSVSQAAAVAPSDAPAGAWVLHYDERHDWGRAPLLFDSKEAALDYVSKDHSWWAHSDHPYQNVMDALSEVGEYTFEPEDDFQDDYDPYQIWLQQVPIKTPDLDGKEEEVEQKQSPYLIFFDAPVAYREQGLTWDSYIFEDENTLFSFVEDNNVVEDCPDWKNQVKAANDCSIKAHFRPEVWINDNATEVDPEGDQDWAIEADELDPSQSDLDYLKSSRNAPKWVQEWSGPFTITLDITHGNLFG